jgi:hypothetical protein
MGENKAVANIIYSTRETPVNLNGDVDVVKAEQEEVRFPKLLQTSVTNIFHSLPSTTVTGPSSA